MGHLQGEEPRRSLTCCKLIESNRGIRFGDRLEGLDYVDPEQNIAGWYEKKDKSGNWVRYHIPLNDKPALSLANEQKTDAVFQFDTDLAKRILSNGVQNFADLMLFNAMGHPGPMDSIPEAVKNRADTSGKWQEELRKLDPVFYEVLKDTYGVIVYQEQLAAIWQGVAGFTSPEAQDARKAVAKKWRHLLKPVEAKWMAGASKRIGEKLAAEWWAKMVTFGRYAFEPVYTPWAYCSRQATAAQYLKAHYPPRVVAFGRERTAHPDKLVRYMGVASGENVVFDTLNIDKLSINFTATDDNVNQGLIGLKRVGLVAARAFEFKPDRDKFRSIDEFVVAHPKNKTVLERLIKLGSFARLDGHQNRYALWNWYLYRYGSGPEAAEVKRSVMQRLLADRWSEESIRAERARQVREYKSLYPKSAKIPRKLMNWTPAVKDDRESVMALFPMDYTTPELLAFEKEYLGYYISTT